MTGTEPIAIYLHLQESKWVGVDFGRGKHATSGLPLRDRGLLRAGDKLAGAPTAVPSATGLLTIAGTVINVADWYDTDALRGIVAEEGVLFKVTPLQVGSHIVTVKCTDNVSPTPNIQAVDLIINVSGTAPPAP